MLNYAYAILKSQLRMTCRATKHVGGLRCSTVAPCHDLVGPDQRQIGTI